MNPTLFGKRGFCIIGGMMRVLPLVLLCAVVHAAEVALPPAPPPAFADTESVTNAPLGRALSFEVRVAENGTPRVWTVSTIGGGAFTNFPVGPPEWSFSRDWTTVRLAVRGVDARDETVSVRLDTDPGVLILR